ncbi:22K [Simian adenovirus 17]|uniref:22K n=1 Tax=Simian adenovirus 17 TaxID=1715779 RepID=A0A2H4CK27_9ADEN|nr:22K [Simian adenovirus 17]
MSPKGNKPAIAQRRAKKQQELQEQWDEESWDSQAEEVSDEEEMESWDSLDEEAEELEDEPLEEEEPSSAAAPSASKEAARSRPAQKQQQQRPPPSPPTPPPGSLKASRRWDAVSIAGSPKAPAGKPPGRSRRGYCSWRSHKSKIVACLQHCRGNISFARRYLLFHDGVAVPRNVLYYYRHLYSPYETEGPASA